MECARHDLYRPGAYLARLAYDQQCKRNNINDFYEEHIYGICIKGSVIFGYLWVGIYMWYSSSFLIEGIIFYNQCKKSKDVIRFIDTKFINVE